MASKSRLSNLIEGGEDSNGSVEFKSQLKEKIHLQEEKRDSLVAQMRYRIVSGDGEAIYVIGVTDDGEEIGLSPQEFKESMEVLSVIAEASDSYIESVDTWEKEDGKIIGMSTIRSKDISHQERENHLIIGTAGHVDHGKSTLVGCLMTGRTDDGDGETRQYLDVKPHEIDRGLSADLSYGLYGFNEQDKPIRIGNPKRTSDRSSLVENADRVVSFVDTVGHKPWLRTTIRGIIGQKIDYGLVTVAVDDGPTETTKEHFGILTAAEIPTIVALTKTDMVSESRVDEVEKNVEKMIRKIESRFPIVVDRHGIKEATEEVTNGGVPVIRTNSVNMDGYDDLDYLFANLRTRDQKDSGSLMYIDKKYNIDGVGTVVSGTVRSGSISVGDTVKIGPFSDGDYKESTVRSIEIHYHNVDKAVRGQIASMSVSDVDYESIERGMVLLPQTSDEKSVRKFEAELMVLNHPTKITGGYEPVTHIETISESTIVQPKRDQLTAGQKGYAEVEFKYGRHYIEEGQKLVFREGESKGVGRIKKIID